MKFLTQWLLVFLTVLNPIFSSAALTDFDRQELPVKNWLAPYNSGFESSKAKWTASGGTFAAVTSGTNLLVGKGSATWDGSSASQTLTSQTITIEKGYYGQNCEAGIVAQVPSGTATHTVQAYDGTNILVSATIVSSTTPRLNTVNFPCPQSGTVALRLVTVASDEPLIAIDDAYLGLARNVGGTQLISEWEAWTPSSSWTGGSITYTGFKRRVGTNQEVKFRIALGGAPTGSGLTLNVPSECVVDTAKVTGNNARVPLGNTIIFDSDTGANIYGTVQANNTTSVALNVILTGNASTSPIGQVGASTPITFASGDSIDGYFSVPCVGWAASTVVMPDAQGWFAAASITGASASLSTTTQASFTEITNGSLTLTPSSGSALIGIACASGTTNSSGATTCASANESLGVTVSVPTSGAYRVCASASNFLEDTGAATNVNATQTFKINRTSNANSTVVTSGDATAYTVLKTNSGGGGEVLGSAYPFSICSVFSLSSGSNTFRLMYSSSIAGTLATNTVDIAGGVSQSAYFRVEPVNSQQQAILANSVSTSATNGLKTESFSFTCSGSSSIGVQLGGTSWVSSIGNISSGACAVVIAAGVFSGTPQCQATWTGGGSNSILYTYLETSTGFSIGGVTDTGAAATSFTGKAMCVGPR